MSLLLYCRLSEEEVTDRPAQQCQQEVEGKHIEGEKERREEK